MPRARRLLVALCLAAVASAAPAADGAAADRSVRVWFTSGEQFKTVHRRVPASGATLVPTVRALLEGPTARERRRNIDTQIPPGVSLHALTVAGAGVAVLDLSPRFLRGIRRDPADRTAAQTATLGARLGQVVYTATQFGDIRSAKVSVAGVVLDSDVERSDFTRPTTPPLATVRSEGTAVSGTRRVQERLVALGYLPADGVDGLYGYRTRQAVIAFQAWQGLARDGVAGPMTKAELARAGRPSPRPGSPARRIEVYRERGVALLISRGRTVRAIHVSTGAGANATPTGRYKVFRKELRSWSVPFRTWLPYASYFNAGIAFHEYADVPSRPASHGCVRVPAPEARYVYAFAELRTTVIVY
jgi:lipoprotein-anchoring transpeptidase ErfK/SrfK